MDLGHQAQDSGLMVLDHLVLSHEVFHHLRAWTGILRDLVVRCCPEILDQMNLIQKGKNLIQDIHDRKVLSHKALDLKVLNNGYLTLMTSKVLAPGVLPIQMTLIFIRQSQMILIHEEFIQMNLTLVDAVPPMVLILGDPQEKDLILGCHIQRTLILGVLDQMVLIAEDEVQDQISFLLVVSLAQGE
jgi:hypothetical protein